MADRIIQMKDNQGNNLFPLVKISPSILEGNYLPITGGTLTGDLILKGDPTSLLMPATKQYVDNKFGNYLPLSGGTLTGVLSTQNINPSADNIYSLGTSSYRYGNIFSVAGTIETLNATTVNTSGNLSVNSNASIIDLLTLGKQRVSILDEGQSGNINLVRLIPYKHTGGPWYINSYDDHSSAYLRILYDNDQTFSLRHDGYVWVTRLYGAVWNDYAEYRKSDDNEPGRVVMEDKKGILQRTTERLQPFAGVVSDTFGFSQGETDEAKTPLAVAGRVLVYPYRPREEYNPGDCVCAAPDGTVDIMTRQEIRDWPDRIVGTVSEIPDYETWGTGNVEVNGRIWIKVR